MVFSPRLLAALASATVLVVVAPAKNYRVTLSAADVDRAMQVIRISLPRDAARATGLKSSSGAMLPLQVEKDATASFIVPLQKAGETLVFTTVEAPAAPNLVEAVPDHGRLHLRLAGQPIFDYQMDKDAVPRPDIKPEYKRAGYLHPIYTASGTIVSDDYPVQHVHHHGIWTPWTKTSFQGRSPDFWNMGQKTGTVEFVALDQSWSGPVHGGFVARHRFVDLSAPSPVVALYETWQVTAFGAPGDARLFELRLTQTCATDDPLILPTYHYGGLGYRGRGEWLGRDKAKFLTSDGETDRVKANTQKMRWIHLYGQVGKGVSGLTILGHPDNFRAPQPVRVHPNEPYVSFTPSQGGEWKIEPGHPYTARYRFVAFDGPPDAAKLDALWNGFARPAAVTLAAEGSP